MSGADAEPGFEALYARAGDDLRAIPWASLSAHPALIQWLDRTPEAHGQSALVVGCGLGDDAEELSRRGWRVVAFDVAPTAVVRCRQRFAGSAVEYRVADVFALPGEWRDAFDLVVEIRTLQSLPVDQRERAALAMAGAVKSGGRLFVRCLARDDDEPVAARPWPVSRRDLAVFATAGLAELEFVDDPGADGGGRSFTAVYRRD